MHGFKAARYTRLYNSGCVLPTLNVPFRNDTVRGRALACFTGMTDSIIRSICSHFGGNVAEQNNVWPPSGRGVRTGDYRDRNREEGTQGRW